LLFDQLVGASKNRWWNFQPKPPLHYFIVMLASAIAAGMCIAGGNGPASTPTKVVLSETGASLPRLSWTSSISAGVICLFIFFSHKECVKLTRRRPCLADFGRLADLPAAFPKHACHGVRCERDRGIVCMFDALVPFPIACPFSLLLEGNLGQAALVSFRSFCRLSF